MIEQKNAYCLRQNQKHGRKQKTGERYISDEKLKKKYLSNWMKEKKPYRTRHTISWILYLIAIGLLAFFSLTFSILTNFTLVGILGGVGCGCVCAVFPFGIGMWIQTKAVREYGFPFSRREKEYLLLSEIEGIEFGFSDVDNIYAESMNIYSIRKEKVTAINLTGNILTIIGEGSLTVILRFLFCSRLKKKKKSLIN